MAILQSCCFWRSVREGSFASALYTLIYFGFAAVIFLCYANEERHYLQGEREQPTGESLLEKGDITPTTVIFNMLFLGCSLLLIIASALVIVGLRCNERAYLLPWIVLMLGDVLIEIAHLVYLAISRRVTFEPVVGFVFTLDFFIMCLNCYCLVCVISQYQEYKMGRGGRHAPALGGNATLTDTSNATLESPTCLKTFAGYQQPAPAATRVAYPSATTTTTAAATRRQDQQQLKTQQE